MSTLAEIENVLPKLTPDELARLESRVHQLQRQRGQGGNADVAELERRNGFDVFSPRNAQRITVEAVQQLCAEEGI
jgi:hypothetical protein